jgi:cytochrome c biogenesis protein CcmG, thiol:disulfide interchange protein DsbE
VKRRSVTVIVLAVLAALVSSAVIANLSAGTKAPNFTLPKLDGKTFTLKDCFKQPGKVVLLDIWATWCGPCRAEIPFIIKLQKKYGAKKVLIVGVAIDADKADVKSFAKQQNMNYTICHDPNAKTVGKSYEVRGIPATYVIDKKGVIRYVHEGFGGAEDAASMDKEIASLLK